ncbi:hypothetical protein SAMN05518672_1177 [Chitinophaga sp. CF118]|nr:hypothetical protein SAMN05518672_1177 [Chitinophaga sp. CF118]
MIRDTWVQKGGARFIPIIPKWVPLNAESLPVNREAFCISISYIISLKKLRSVVFYFIQFFQHFIQLTVQHGSYTLLVSPAYCCCILRLSIWL